MSVSRKAGRPVASASRSRERHVLPAGHGGRADEAHRLHAERAGHRHADAEHAAVRPQPGQFRHQRADQFEGVVGRGVRRRRDGRSPTTSPPRLIRAASMPSGVRWMPTAKPPVRVDAQRRRRKPAAARLFAQRQDVALLFELADDGGDGLDGEPDALGDVAARGRAVQADRLQHDAPVVRPPELLVCPPQCHAAVPSRTGSFAPAIYSVKWISKIGVDEALLAPWREGAPRSSHNGDLGRAVAMLAGPGTVHAQRRADRHARRI